jgi:DASH complex subunit SPC19
LQDEIGPFIALLLDRADKQIERQERRIETLKARNDLQQGRLSHGPAGGSEDERNSAAKRSRPGGSGGFGKQLDREAQLRARAVRQRKEALKYSVERLELEVMQKERELKKRLENA